MTRTPDLPSHTDTDRMEPPSQNTCFRARYLTTHTQLSLDKGLAKLTDPLSLALEEGWVALERRRMKETIADE